MTKPHHSEPSVLSSQPTGELLDLGPMNAWSILALTLASSDWFAGLHAQTRLEFALRCRKIAVAFHNDQIHAPDVIDPTAIAAWIKQQTSHDTVAASFHIAFGRLLTVAGRSGLAPRATVTRRPRRSARPKPASDAAGSASAAD